MKKKKEDKAIDFDSYLNKAGSRKSIEDLSALFKEFLKEAYNFKDSDTFVEMQEHAKRKRIDAKAKHLITEIAELVEALEYRPKKPSTADLSQVRALIRDLIKSHVPLDRPKKKKEPIIKRVAKIKETVRKQVQKKVVEKHKIIIDENDPEIKQMRQFLEVSLSAGMQRNEVRSELFEMGFPKAKVDLVLRMH